MVVETGAPSSASSHASPQVRLVYRADRRAARGLVPGPRLRLALPRALVHVLLPPRRRALGGARLAGLLRALRRGPGRAPVDAPLLPRAAPRERPRGGSRRGGRISIRISQGSRGTPRRRRDFVPTPARRSPASCCVHERRRGKSYTACRSFDTPSTSFFKMNVLLVYYAVGGIARRRGLCFGCSCLDAPGAAELVGFLAL